MRRLALLVAIGDFMACLVLVPLLTEQHGADTTVLFFAPFALGIVPLIAAVVWFRPQVHSKCTAGLLRTLSLFLWVGMFAFCMGCIVMDLTLRRVALWAIVLMAGFFQVRPP